MNPCLLGSFNRDGEAKAGLVEKRDKDLRVNTAEIRRNRRDLEQLAKPQEGVIALKTNNGALQPIPGVVEKNTTREGG